MQALPPFVAARAFKRPAITALPLNSRPSLTSWPDRMASWSNTAFVVLSAELCALVHRNGRSD